MSYTNLFNSNRLASAKITLPVSSSGSLDWDFMSDYIRVMEKLVIRDVVDWKDKELALTRELVEDSENKNKVK